MKSYSFSLDGRVAVVTGASRGIGRAIALGLAEAGSDIIAASRSISDIEALAREIEGMGRRATAVATDVTQGGDVERLVQQALKAFGRVDILVNSAGVSPYYKRAELLAEEEWDVVLDTNLKGVFLCCKEAGKVMIAQRSGAIINIASVGAQVGLPRLAAYCAAKGGIVQLTKVLALEWAEHNIRVNCIGPAFVDTDMTKGLQESPRYLQPLLDQTPLGRFAKPEEVVGAAVYLASDAASYVTGQTIYVDGGWTAK